MVKKGAPSLCTSPIQRSIFNHGDTSLLPSPLIYHALTIFFSTDAAILMRSSHRNGDAKRTVRINCFFAILQLSRSPFFQLNRCIWSHRAIRDISAHRCIFAPPSLWRARVYWNKAAMQKERWKKIVFWRLYSSFTHHFFNKIVVFGAMISPCCSTNPLCLLIRSGAVKKMVRFCYKSIF